MARRGSVLDGLCATLGVDESTGRLVGGSASAARHLDVRFEGEVGGGDGLRREWFGEVLGELLDPNRGLFAVTGGRTLQPNPHSATAAGPDHLSYFVLLGRIAGLALCHCEPLTASWSSVCEHNLGPHLFQLVENFARTSPRAHPHAHPHTTAPLSPHALRACCVVGRSS